MEDALIIQVWITKEDLDEIKRIEEIATSVNDSYLSFGPELVHDMNFNTIMASAGLQVDSFVEDTTPPELISYDLDMNSDLLRLTFSETVDADTIQHTYFALLDAPNSTDPYGSYMLTGGDSTQLDSTMINLTFSKVDSDEIRRLYNLATSNETTYLVVQLGGILDMNANPLVSVNESDPFPVREFTPDTTDPELISFDLNLDANQLFLTFSETVDITTFDLEQITSPSYKFYAQCKCLA